MIQKKRIREVMLISGVKNLQEYGYPHVTAENILTDEIYSAFFKESLKDTLGKRADIDAEIKKLLEEIDKNNPE